MVDAGSAALKAARMVRESVDDLFDQRTPFGRLALTHVLSTAGDTLVTISLAGSLFFSISPQAAKNKVILYLVLTMLPFGVVAPLLGPVIDRSRGARRAMVVASGVGRAIVVVLMARDIKSLLLFPEAFMALVLSKVYLVTKGALVPLLANRTPDPGEPPIAHTVPAAGAPGPGGSRYPIPWRDPVADPHADTPPRGVPAARAGDTPPAGTPAVRPPPPSGPPDLSVLNARLGLLASIAGFVAAIPAVIVLKFIGGAAAVLWLDMAVFAATAVAGYRLPLNRPAVRRRGVPPTPAPSGVSLVVDAATATPTSADSGDDGWSGAGPLEALGPRAATHPEVILAASAMSLLRGMVGFVTFLLAFELRRSHAGAWWFGFMLGASTLGALIGVISVPRVRRVMGEPQMIAASVWSVAVAGSLAAVVGGRMIQSALAFVIGLTAAAAKPGFDALVQRYVPVASQGRAFARFETRLQFAWVVGGLIPVIFALPFVAGDIVIATVAGVSATTYLTGRRALRHHLAAPEDPAPTS